MKEVKDIAKLIKKYRNIDNVVGELDDLDKQLKALKQLKNSVSNKISKISSKLKPANFFKNSKNISKTTKNISNKIGEKLSKSFTKAINNNISKTNRAMKAFDPSITKSVSQIDIAADVIKKGNLNNFANQINDARNSVKAVRSTIDTAEITAEIAQTTKTAVKSSKAAAKAATKSAKAMTKALKAIGPAFIIGGAAMCFCEANSVGELEYEYKDDSDAVRDANIACGIELAIDIALEALEALAAVALFAALGPIGAVIAVIIAAFQLITALFDMFDECGYERLLSTDKELLELRNNIIYGFMSNIQEVIDNSKDIYNNFKKSIIETCNMSIDQSNQYTDVKQPHLTIEQFEEFLNNSNNKIKILGSTLYSYLGYDLKTYLNNIIDEQIRTMKFPKPIEFNKTSDGFEYNMKPEDFEKFLQYQSEYYIICDLVPNPISIEDLQSLYV